MLKCKEVLSLNSTPPERRAVLLFGDSLALDLARRRWPRAFARLLRFPMLSSDWEARVDFHLFSTDGTPVPTTPLQATVHRQRGRTFAQRLENAVETLAGLGYTRIVIVGRDCPDLSDSDVQTAFGLLDSHRLVLGPDHRGGCYLIALHLKDRSILKGICWQKNTDCRDLQTRLEIQRCFLLPVRYDLDTIRDVRLLALSRGRWQHLAETLLRLLGTASMPGPPLWVETGRLRERTAWQLPPPHPHPIAVLA